MARGLTVSLGGRKEDLPIENNLDIGGGGPAPTGTDPGTSGETPGPSPDPGGGQDGPPSPKPPPPPPRPTAVPGIQESETTGGVQGSFAQAGTADFNRRFGSQAPANWFRRTLGQLPNTRWAKAATRSGGGQAAGIPSPSANPDFGGRPGDMDWERFMQQVRRNMFS